MTPPVDAGLPGSKRFPLLGTPMGWTLSLILAALGAYLLTYHTTHVFLLLPYTLLLACPLMHFFGHGGHGHAQAAPEAAPTDSPAVSAHADESRGGAPISKPAQGRGPD
ncbi:DUF2933 domain-containing protein [Methylobacterium sp. WL116]|nr:DUF2933 domain-containing protein [Methylobacterium sp. WL116]